MPKRSREEFESGFTIEEEYKLALKYYGRNLTSVPAELRQYFLEWKKIPLVKEIIRLKQAREIVVAKRLKQFLNNFKSFDTEENKFSKHQYEMNPLHFNYKNLGRTHIKITKEDLTKFLHLCREDFNNFCERNPIYKQMKLIAICLAQGGANHYINEKSGIRDLDFYLFFDDNCPVKYPVRLRHVVDLGYGKFGTTVQLAEKEFVGKACDIMGRSIPYDGDYVKSIQDWLSKGKSKTPYYLSLKSMVILHPFKDLGKVIWKDGKISNE